MKRMLTAAAWAAALWCLPTAAMAQQPCPMADSARAPMSTRMREWDQRLETKLAQVDKTKGDKKVAALAEVVRELVAQRREMHAGMGPGGGPMHGPHGPGMQGAPCPMGRNTGTGVKGGS